LVIRGSRVDGFQDQVPVQAIDVTSTGL